MIAQFSEISAADVGLFGGKGANLGEMTRAGLPVPPGFCVSVDAYRRFLALSGLDDRIVALLARPDHSTPSRIRSLLAASPVPRAVAEEVVAAYLALGDGTAVAVRSSATAEDLPEASFAGQQDTYLGVRGSDGLVDALSRCWASLWTDRAFDYRRRHGFDHAEVGLAVVVQCMVDAETAGVLFTADPVSGRHDRFLVNASWGLGESVVSGRVTPDSFTVARTTGRIVEQTVGAKATRIDRADTGTRTTEVPASERSRPCLTKAQISELTRLGRQVEAHYGAPQDIEWAFAGSRLWLLQARPVTTVAAGESSAPRERHGRLARWIHDDLVEHYPAPFPLDHAAVVAGFAEMRRAEEEMGVLLPPAQDLIVMDEEGIAEVGHPRVVVRPLRTLRWLRRSLAVDPAGWDAGHGRRFAQRHDALSCTSPQLRSMSGPDVDGHITDALRLASDIARTRFSDFVFPQGVRGGRLTGWLALAGVGGELTAWDFLAGLDYTTAVIDRELRHLAGRADTPELREILLQNDAAEALRLLRTTASAAPFAACLQTFLDAHGARTMRVYLPFSARSWSEDPTALVAAVAAVLRGGQAPVTHETTVDETIDRVAARLPRPLRARFTRTVHRFRAGHQARESSLYAIEQAYVLARRGMDEAGRRLVDAGLLTSPDDVVFLTLAEVRAFLHDRPGTSDPAAAVERRRTARPRAVSTWWRSDPRDGAEVGAVTGVAGSPGRATGPVRIIEGPHDFERLQPGDVLVCQFTDPAWTPLFGLAAAVVADTGGQLSHAAIVAREYGIPAVLGTHIGTTTLHDGHMVDVDGTAGTVRPAFVPPSERIPSVRPYASRVSQVYPV